MTLQGSYSSQLSKWTRQLTTLLQWQRHCYTYSSLSVSLCLNRKATAKRCAMSMHKVKLLQCYQTFSAAVATAATAAAATAAGSICSVPAVHAATLTATSAASAGTFVCVHVCLCCLHCSLIRAHATCLCHTSSLFEYLYTNCLCCSHRFLLMYLHLLGTRCVLYIMLLVRQASHVASDTQP